MLSKYTAVFLIPSTFLFLLINRTYRKWLLRKEPYIALLISLLVFSPVIVWNYYHQWASFAFQFCRRFSEDAVRPFLTFLEFFGSQMGVLFPTFFLSLLLGFVISFRLSIKGAAPKWQFSFLYSFPLLALFVFYSFKSEVKVNWPLPAYLSLLWAAYPAYRYIRLRTKGRWKALIPRAATLSTYLMPVIFLPFLYHLSIGIPSVPALPKMGGWEQLGTIVDKAEATMGKETGKHPFLLGMSKYYIAAELGFYTDDLYETFSVDLLGGRSLGFKYWTNKENLRNRDALIISERYPNIDFLKNFFTRVDQKVRQIPLLRQGRVMRTFYLIRCYGYTG